MRQRVRLWKSLLLVWVVFATVTATVQAATPLVRLAVENAATAPAVPDAALLLGLTLLAVGSVITMKDMGTLAQKFMTRANAASGDYTAGATGKGATMEAAAKASNQAWKDGINGAMTRDAFSKGLNGAAAKYEDGVKNKGAVRYGPGVQASGGRWAAGFQPYADKLKSLTLPPKGARRSPQNQQRSTAVQLALGALKEGK